MSHFAKKCSLSKPNGALYYFYMRNPILLLLLVCRVSFGSGSEKTVEDRETERCEKGILEGCIKASEFYSKSKQPTMASHYQEKGCALKSVKMCIYFARSALQEDNTPGAIDGLKSACELGHKESCKKQKELVKAFDAFKAADSVRRAQDRARFNQKMSQYLLQMISIQRETEKAQPSPYLGVSNNDDDNNSANNGFNINYGNVSCGAKPIPEAGCSIGRCINGSWEQICNNCGVKPITQAGCRIGRCVDGAWEQICNNCGVQPVPQAGCKIGRCVDGAWEQICN